VLARDAGWSDGIERLNLGPDVPPVITKVSLVPAGSRRDDAVVPMLIAAKEAGLDITDVIWDRGYSQLSPARNLASAQPGGHPADLPPEGSATHREALLRGRDPHRGPPRERTASQGDVGGHRGDAADDGTGPTAGLTSPTEPSSPLPEGVTGMTW
jgi:hypothetical protein